MVDRTTLEAIAARDAAWMERNARLTNKDGISVEETRALLEGMEGVHAALSTAELREAAEPLARAYLALSEREAAKDAEIARLRREEEHKSAWLLTAAGWFNEYAESHRAKSVGTGPLTEAYFLKAERNTARANKCEQAAALTKGQVDAG